MDSVAVDRADCPIAAAAVTIGARLATGNPADFPVEHVTVDRWPAGS